MNAQLTSIFSNSETHRFCQQQANTNLQPSPSEVSSFLFGFQPTGSPSKLDSIDITSHFSHDSSSSSSFSSSNSVSSNDFAFEHQTLTLYCANCGYRYVATLKCRNWRVCPFCLDREAKRLKAQYSPLIKGKDKDYLRLITVTIPNKKELHRTDIRRIKRRFRQLLRRKPYRRWILGGLYTVEVVNKGRGFNIHIHALIETRIQGVLLGSRRGKRHTNFEEKLSEDWQKVTRGEANIVDIKNVYSPSGGLNYILKYFTKPPILQPGQEEVYCEAFRGLRALSAFGSWYGKHTSLPKLKCPVCGGQDWISEYELQQLGARAHEVNSA